MAKLTSREKKNLERRFNETRQPAERKSWEGFRSTVFKTKKTDITAIRREGKKLCRDY